MQHSDDSARRFIAGSAVVNSITADAPAAEDRAVQPILEMRGITKHFAGVLALDHVDLSVRPGEIHALLGQNGAGKSTLMKTLAGVYPLEEGEIRIDGKSVAFGHPRQALALGVGTVYQDLSLVPHLSVANNIFLGREAGNGFVIDQAEVLRRTARILDDLGVRGVSATARISRLPLAHQQLVEIAKVLSHEPRILVLDEPTAPLAEEETRHLFDILHGLKQKGIAIIFISHRFKEVLQHCDRATVLRNGKLVKTVELKNVSEEELVELTIGERLETFYRQDSAEHSAERETVLEVEHLSVGRTVRDVSFTLHKGEIVGLTGLLGAGQNELARALFGIQPRMRGTIRLHGRPVKIGNPAQAVRLGIGLLTEHRKAEGLVPEMSVRENITLASLRRFRWLRVFIDNIKELGAAQAFIKQLNIVVASVKAKVSTLSGGNQQKTILAKWLLRDLDILIFISPTQGIDVGAKAEIYHDLTRLTHEGKSIIVVSEDLLEILGVSDRILVMFNGRLTRTFDRSAADEESMLSAIQGQTA